MPTLPADLQQILDDIDAADRAGEAIALQVTHEQFHWRPRDGQGWSIAQCLDHLAVINVFYSAPVQQAVDGARARGWTRRGPAAPGFFGRRFIASQEPPVKRRFSAPGRVRPAAATRSREEILGAYHHAHTLVRRLIADAAEVDINRTTFPNPFIRIIRMRVATALLVLAAHDRRHLWQAEQVRTAPGFPAPLARSL
jgi:DinB family protein